MDAQEFDRAMRDYLDTITLKIARDCEKVWPFRVHVALCVIPIEGNDLKSGPAVVAIVDTMGGAPVNMRFVGDQYYALAEMRLAEGKNEKH